MSWRDECSRIFIGNLPMDVRERELEDLFHKYGRIRNIDMKVGERQHARLRCVVHASLQPTHQSVHPCLHAATSGYFMLMHGL